MSSTARRGYGRFWAGLLPELGFLLPTSIVVLVVFVGLTALFWTGVGLIAFAVGVLIIVATLYAARGIGIVETLRLRAAGFPRIVAPQWNRVSPASTGFARFMAATVDGHYWLYLLHGMVVNPIVGMFTSLLTALWLAVALVGIILPFVPDYGSSGVVTLIHYLAGDRISDVMIGIGAFVLGVVFAATLPFVTHGFTWLHHAIASGMLSEFRSEELRVQMADLSASRTAAVAAEGTALRRLERDIHDGPQQRLVRLQMDLASAERQIDKNPDAARELIAGAAQLSRDALEELRALSRGFAPPILMDRGLVAALESLAVRSALPIHVEDRLPDGVTLPTELERNAYFIAAEGLANVAKHAQARNAWVRLELREDERGIQWLDVVVSDDGVGGATSVAGHGLAGIDERVYGLGGRAEISSPVGGPTILIARLPFAGGSAGAR